MVIKAVIIKEDGTTKENLIPEDEYDLYDDYCAMAERMKNDKCQTFVMDFVNDAFKVMIMRNDTK